MTGIGDRAPAKDAGSGDNLRVNGLDENPGEIPPFPWQQSAWEAWMGKLLAGRAPHGILVSAPAGIGEWAFARCLAAALCCQHPGESRPCGRCRSCQLWAAGTHPDIADWQPEKQAGVLRIDQVRALSEFLAKTPLSARCKVALLFPADSLNTQAANALLKTLEEPADDSYIVLVANSPSRLPATVRSRCQDIRLPAPGVNVSREWLADRLPEQTDLDALLALSGNRPLQALAAHEAGLLPIWSDMEKDLLEVNGGRQSPIRVAEKWLKEQPDLRLEWWAQWLSGQIRTQALGEGFAAGSRGPDNAAGMAMGTESLFRQLSAVYQAKHDTLASNPNRQLQFESLLIGWSGCGSLAEAG